MHVLHVRKYQCNHYYNTDMVFKWTSQRKSTVSRIQNDPQCDFSGP